MSRLMRHLILAALLTSGPAMWAQFSPGDLAEAHAEYDKLSKCTECHTLGQAITEQKCLDCHDEIATRIDADRGYHVSEEVQEKTCFDCHSEHHGKDFQLIRLDEDEFDHDLTGYPLEGGHIIDCRECHKTDYIQDDEVRDLEDTYLGLEQGCLTCHEDEHQETLPESCLDCHGMETWEDPPHFDHDLTDFVLRGAHIEVDCKECHKETMRNGREFTEFADVAHALCTDCHEDEHEGRFGNKCLDCHDQWRWGRVRNEDDFDHDLTDFPLEGQHQTVDCRECHTDDNLLEPLAHERCLDCHEDYHDGQLRDALNAVRDCDDCHDLAHDFTYSRYSIEDHAASEFPLEGAHMATPCFACHREDPEKDWDFDVAHGNCVDCHDNPHGTQFDVNGIAVCQECHTVDNMWNTLAFDHDDTEFPLKGEHERVDCGECHKPDPMTAIVAYQMKSFECIDCHGESINSH